MGESWQVLGFVDSLKWLENVEDIEGPTWNNRTKSEFSADVAHIIKRRYELIHTSERDDDAILPRVYVLDVDIVSEKTKKKLFSTFCWQVEFYSIQGPLVFVAGYEKTIGDAKRAALKIFEIKLKATHLNYIRDNGIYDENPDKLCERIDGVIADLENAKKNINRNNLPGEMKRIEGMVDDLALEDDTEEDGGK